MLQVKAAPSPDAVNFVTIDPHPGLWRSHPNYRHVEVSIIDYMRQACKDILVRVHHTRREFEIAVDLILSVHGAIFNPPDNLTRLYQFPMYPVTSTTVTVTTTLTPSVDAGAVAVTPTSPVSVTPTSQADPATKGYRIGLPILAVVAAMLLVIIVVASAGFVYCVHRSRQHKIKNASPAAVEDGEPAEAPSPASGGKPES